MLLASGQLIPLISLLLASSMDFTQSPKEYSHIPRQPNPQPFYNRVPLQPRQHFHPLPSPNLPTFDEDDFDGFVDPDINGLAQVSAARQDLYNLNPHQLILINDGTHLMHAVFI